tara:strand:- start:4265 stop:5818 length:1554 start_codon:yes stop_codon:yes gene_type:complete
MKYLSLFSGIEAATVGWHHLGWECVGVSEIDPFACEVLKQRLPNTPNLGDITKITKEQLNEKYPNGLDIVVGGSPCQAFSIAGLRKGLEDPRGNLMLEYIRIVATVLPTYFIWENVPGVLSSNKGRDFGTLLQAMEQLGYNMCWRTLDSKNFGVPQRRRRVFLVGSTRNGKHPFEILFECESLQRDNTESRETRKDNTPKTPASTEEHDRIFLTNTRSEVRYSGGNGLTAGCISASSGINQTNYLMTKTPESTGKHDNRSMTVYHSNHRSVPPKEHTQCPTLLAHMGTGGNNVPVTLMNPAQPNNSPKETHYAPSLIARMGTGGNQVPLIVFPFKYPRLQQHAGCLMASDGAYKLDHQTVTSEKLIVEKQYASTLCARDHKGVASDSFGHDSQQLVNTKTKVRRLTPIECERLQGFPDNWTRISWKGKEPKDCPTSHRYKCLGNSMTTNVMRWIGERIAGVPTSILKKKYHNEQIHAIGCDLYNTSIDTDGKCPSLTTTGNATGSGPRVIVKKNPTP